ncbi:MAG: hypothetical protein Kow0069_28630 [Promethearchaeota archaeon]
MKRTSLVLAFASLVASLALSSVQCTPYSPPTSLRVWTYDNEPLVGVDVAGAPTGIYVDLLDEIAKRRGWAMEYVHGDWPAGLEATKRGDVDLLTAVAFSEERAQFLAFSNETWFTNWGEVLARGNVEVDSILDLEGRRVAVLADDIYYVGPEGVEALANSFEVNCSFVEYETYFDVLAATSNGSADAGVTNRLYAEVHGQENEFNVKRTGVYFSPISLRVAAPLGSPLNEQVLGAIDQLLVEWKADEDSPYFSVLEKYLGEPPPAGPSEVPPWAIALVVAGAVLGLLFSVFSWYLKRALAGERKRSEQLVDEAMKSHRLAVLGAVAGGIAHDFNNLLAVVLGNLSLLEHDLDEMGARLPPVVPEVRKAAIKARDLANQLLTFAKGGAPLTVPLDLNPLVEEAAKFVAHGRPVTLEFKLANDLWVVEADPIQMEQVVQNLVLNAVQVTPAGGKVVVSTKNIIFDDPRTNLTPGPHVVIAVRDFGPGMPPELVERAFEPFFTTKPKGTGLGLTIASSITGRHGGVMKVWTEPGRGSKFKVILPAVPDAERPKPTSQPERVAALPREAKLLVLEDEEALANLLRNVLPRLGVDEDHFLVVGDGMAAVEAYKEALEGGRRYDLVLLDLTVPGAMGGLEAMQMLKKIDPAVRAVVTSGYSQEPVMANYKEHGFVGVLKKPFTMAEFSNVMSSALDQSRE